MRKAIDRNAEDYKNELEKGAKQTENTLTKMKSKATGTEDQNNNAERVSALENNNGSHPARRADRK